MEKSENIGDVVQSLHMPERIEISGFEAADNNAHMLEWLQRGRDFRNFVVHDIEARLYEQNADLQLLSVICKEKPDFETIVKTSHQGQTGVVAYFSVVFPLSLCVRDSSGVVQVIDASMGYHAANLDVPDKFELSFGFTITGQQTEARIM